MSKSLTPLSHFGTRIHLPGDRAREVRQVALWTAVMVIGWTVAAFAVGYLVGAAQMAVF